MIIVIVTPFRRQGNVPESFGYSRATEGPFRIPSPVMVGGCQGRIIHGWLINIASRIIEFQKYVSPFPY